jgi:hypothetical protein
MWNIFEGYKVKAFDSLSISVPGEPIDPQTTIPLNSNSLPYFLPYYYSSYYPIQMMMQFIKTNIRYVQTFEYVNGVLKSLNYIPRYQIDQIKFMKPGLAYKLSLYVPVRSFTYPTPSVITDSINTYGMNTQVNANTFATGENNRILVIPESVIKIPAGAEVRAFKKGGAEVGFEIAQGGNMAVSMWDSASLTDYDEFVLEINNNNTTKSYPLSFSKNTSKDENLYVLDNITAVNDLSQWNLKVKAYPTQVTDEVNLEVTLDKATPVTVTIYNLVGNKVDAKEFSGLNQGVHLLQINVDNLISGQYIYEVKTKNKITRGKIQVIR